MITTSTDSNGRIIVSDDAVTNDTPQEFTVCVKNESDWTETVSYTHLTLPTTPYV